MEIHNCYKLDKALKFFAMNTNAHLGVGKDNLIRKLRREFVDVENEGHLEAEIDEILKKFNHSKLIESSMRDSDSAPEYYITFDGLLFYHLGGFEGQQTSQKEPTNQVFQNLDELEKKRPKIYQTIFLIFLVILIGYYLYKWIINL